ncbi:MAG: carbohydrate-binding family 9-like protein [Hungatella sp.]
MAVSQSKRVPLMGAAERLILQTEIVEDPWNYGNLPKTHVKFSFRQDVGFLVELQCYETGMRAVNQEPDSPVYEDSCMECFLNFYPEESDRYLNFEVNSCGTMLCQVGTGRTDRTFIRDMGMEQPTVEVEKTEDDWKICYRIPCTLIAQIYGHSDFRIGHKLRGNFYKCGDLTPHIHYGCWNRIEAPTPNYHLPQFFGELVI